MKQYSLKEQGLHNRDFVSLQVQNSITKLFKSHLAILDQLKIKHELPPEVAEDIRKIILDGGNDTIREINNLLDVFDFYIDPERLAEAKQNRKVVKKVVVGGPLTVR